MAHHEKMKDARHETAPGPLERATFSAENDCEKSLLILIEEHRSGGYGTAPATSSEVVWNSPTNTPDDFEEDEGYRLDQSLMRLGGNGF